MKELVGLKSPVDNEISPGKHAILLAKTKMVINCIRGLKWSLEKIYFSEFLGIKFMGSNFKESYESADKVATISLT